MNNSKLKSIASFLIALFVILFFTFILHIWFLEINNVEMDVPEDIYYLSYGLNALFVTIVIIVINLLKDRYPNEIGFLFIGSSFLKFVLYFMIFRPIFKADNIVNREEFMSFFIPAMICLITETIHIAKLLRTIDTVDQNNTKKNV